MPSDGIFGNVPDISVGFSDVALLIVSGIGFIVLAVTAYSIVITRLKSTKEIEEEEEDLNYEDRLANADVSTLNRAQRRARANYLMKQKRKVQTGVPGAENEDGEPQVEEEDDDQDSLRHLSREERKKAAKVAEKEERRLNEEERSRQQREAQEAAQQEKRERLKQEAARAEEERRLRLEKKEAQELEAYDQWKTFLQSEDLSLSVLEWIKELQKNRTVRVDDIAERFDVLSSEVTMRIQELLDSARVTGVLESDGRFVYISQEELLSISSVIQGKEKISLQQTSDAISSIVES
jgi:hypothetical protein